MSICTFFSLRRLGKRLISSGVGLMPTNVLLRVIAHITQGFVDGVITYRFETVIATRKDKTVIVVILISELFNFFQQHYCLTTERDEMLTLHLGATA